MLIGNRITGISKRMTCAIWCEKILWQVFFFCWLNKDNCQRRHGKWRKIHTIPGSSNKNQFYPPGSKSEALRLGVHLILLYFIKILFWVRRLFFYLDVGVGVGGGLFFVFKSLDNNIVYSSSKDVYTKEIFADQSLMGFKIWWSWRPYKWKSKSPMYDGFWFFVLNFFFCGFGWSFWYIFIQFVFFNPPPH